MIDLEELKLQNGVSEFEGKEYIVVEQAHIDGYDRPYFEALAICADEKRDEGYPMYVLHWDVLDEWIENGEKYDDMDEACDWEYPDDVSETDLYYNEKNAWIY